MSKARFTIQKGIAIPDRYMTVGIWRELALKMVIGDSVGGLTGVQAVSLCGALNRLGGLGRRARISVNPNVYRVWLIPGKPKKRAAYKKRRAVVEVLT